MRCAKYIDNKKRNVRSNQMMQMMVMMMMMLIAHIGNSEEIDVLSTDETTCSNDAEQVQVLVRELEATQARLAELEKRSSTSIEFDLEWMKKSANEGILSMSKFVSNPWEGGPLIFEKTKGCCGHFEFDKNWYRVASAFVS